MVKLVTVRMDEGIYNSIVNFGIQNNLINSNNPSIIEECWINMNRKNDELEQMYTTVVNKLPALLNRISTLERETYFQREELKTSLKRKRTVSYKHNKIMIQINRVLVGRLRVDTSVPQNDVNPTPIKRGKVDTSQKRFKKSTTD